jgi:hypothetical protein
VAVLTFLWDYLGLLHSGLACLIAIFLWVVLAQYRAWLANLKQLKAQVAINTQLMIEEEADLTYGMLSPDTAWERIMNAWARMEVIEQEFGEGDFIHAGEIIAMKRTLPPVLDSYFAGAHQNHETRRRLRAMLALMRAHNLEIMEDLPED